MSNRCVFPVKTVIQISIFLLMFFMFLCKLLLSFYVSHNIMWYYNHIVSPSVFWFQMLPHTPPWSLSNSWPLLSLTILSVYLFLNILPICIFSGVTIWHWTINWCAHPWRRSSLLLPDFLNCLWYLCRVKNLWTFCHPLWHVHWCHSCLHHICKVLLVRIYGFCC